jgi:hypothetical protein
VTSDEERERHSRRRKKNFYAKVLFDQNEYKGAFSMKVIEPKNKYKREKLSVKEVELTDEDE